MPHFTEDNHTFQADAKAQPPSNDGRTRFPRISRPIELMRSEYDVVVIGSGYGGGVAASRMARANQTVCVLELGKERWPGEYPSTLKDIMPQFHVSGGLQSDSNGDEWTEVGDATGLYHLIVGQGQNVFVGNGMSGRHLTVVDRFAYLSPGLGGTSLLNANVFLRADENALSMNHWPSEIRNDPTCLEKYYQRAESVLEPEPYPRDFPRLPKLDLLEKQAAIVGLEKNFYRVPQTTRFRDGPNATGVEMQTSTLTGTDLTGLNDGSKSSTLVNYLSDAWNWGAEMFCECEVRFIKKDARGQGYIVFFAWRGSKREKFREHFHRDLMWVRARQCVFLGAGSLGTAEILLRSKQRGLSVSSRVGTGMSGNGDVLAFGCGINHETSSIWPPANPTGPTITGIIDCRDKPDPLDNFVIQEGAVPAPLAPIIRPILGMRAGARYFRRLHDSLLTLGAEDEGGKQPTEQCDGLTGAGRGGRTQIYLAMCHDGNEGTLSLKDDKPSLRFSGARRREHVRSIEALLAEATRAVGGAFENSPLGNVLHSQGVRLAPPFCSPPRSAFTANAQ
ncbi:hypothetical protein GP486_003270 [Trichoglossum hirsutum]|uniref:Glucose-methanol-choline oxidoreductase N-terminal domain-containing protein n=1 Tax=Trichoglossum hirsutum TaxID=265104 RepID=A0A9P8LD87_9PEZI|nr:hypothetical protein GP486_003270 [Trichoglossum hirsutum]